MRRLDFLLFFLSLILVKQSQAQLCSQISSNPICAQAPSAQGTMVPFDFDYTCYSAKMNYCFYLETGSISGQAILAVQREDCDYVQIDPVTQIAQTALDSIFITVIGFPKNGDPCDESGYNFQSPCFLLLSQTSFFYLNGLPANSNFMVVVGSNHDQNFGPCSVKVAISGVSFELETTVDPLFIFAGEQASLSTSGASINADYSWTPSEFVSNANSPNPNAFPTSSTVFYVTSYIGSCVVSDSVSLPVGLPITLTSAISPNGDYINDEWVIGGIEKFPKSQVTIYDRWGQSVFQSIGYGTPWNGTNRGKYLPTGSYYYVIELNSAVVFIEPIIGYVTIVR